MKTLVLDVGGTNVKIRLADGAEVRRLPSGPDFTPQQMVDGVREMVKDWNYDNITVGYPGVVQRGRITVEPANLGRGWTSFDFAAAFGKPLRLINDAAMQAVGSYEGGRMLFLGLGTGLGSAMVVDKIIVPMELGHLPYRKKRSFEDYVGTRGLDRLGKKKWQLTVEDVVGRLRDALVADYVVLGGGNAKKLTHLPEGVRLGNNDNAFLGGGRVWTDYPEW